MGRWRVGMKLASVALAACGACRLLGGCGGGHSTTCSVDAGPGGSSSGSQNGMGMLIIGGMVTNCPLADSLSIAPNELDLGQGGMATLAVTASVPDEGMPTFQWSAPSGIFGQPDAPTTTFECTEAGDIRVTATVSYDNCQNQLSGTVTCLAPDGG